LLPLFSTLPPSEICKLRLLVASWRSDLSEIPAKMPRMMDQAISPRQVSRRVTSEMSSDICSRTDAYEESRWRDFHKRRDPEEASSRIPFPEKARSNLAVPLESRVHSTAFLQAMIFDRLRIQAGFVESLAVSPRGRLLRIKCKLIIANDRRSVLNKFDRALYAQVEHSFCSTSSAITPTRVTRRL
jgi:hypothetical protein